MRWSLDPLESLKIKRCQIVESFVSFWVQMLADQPQLSSDGRCNFWVRCHLCNEINNSSSLKCSHRRYWLTCPLHLFTPYSEPYSLIHCISNHIVVFSFSSDIWFILPTFVIRWNWVNIFGFFLGADTNYAILRSICYSPFLYLAHRVGICQMQTKNFNVNWPLYCMWKPGEEDLFPSLFRLTKYHSSIPRSILTGFDQNWLQSLSTLKVNPSLR